MKSIDTKRFALKVITSCVLFAFIVSGSLVTLATTSKPVGEILVTGVSQVGGKSVTVNGEAAKSGRTIFTSSSISTPEGMSAVINLGKAGRIQMAPGSTFVVDVNGNAINGNLTAGNVTVLSSSQSVGVRTMTGETLSLNAGETASATSGSASKAQTGPGGVNWWVWAAIIGGAAAAVILVVTLGDDDDDNITSPVR